MKEIYISFFCGQIFLDPTHSPLDRKQAHMNCDMYTLIFLNCCGSVIIVFCPGGPMLQIWTVQT